MKNINTKQTTQVQYYKGNVVPMFAQTKMEQPMANNSQTQNETLNPQQAELSVFDVKELYDLAYNYESDSLKFKKIIAQAIQLDMEYRRQLAQKTKRDYKATPDKNSATSNDDNKTSQAA